MLKHRHSLRFRMIIFCLLFGVVLALLIAYNDYSAIRTMQQQSFTTIRRVTDLQCTQLDSTLSSLDTYLSGFVYDSSDVSILSQDDRSSERWFSALYRLRKEFDSTLTVQDADDFFLYVPETSLFLTSSSGFCTQMQGTLEQSIDDSLFFAPKNSGKWVLLSGEGDSRRLVRVLRIRNSYIGAVLDADSLLEKYFGATEDTLPYAFADADGNLLCRDAPAEPVSGFSPDTDRNYVKTRVDGQPYLLLTRILSHTNLSIAVLIPDQALLATVEVYRHVMLVVLGCFLCVLVLAIYLLHRWVAQPVSALTAAIHELRNGDLEAQIEEKASCTEFDEVNQAFNSMVREIKDLKINVYEEQLRHQNTEIAYLTLQITPHFLVNCLNTVYQLTDADRPDLVKHMVRDLSQHLRYMLNSGPAVSLSDEISHVQNFIELSGIRYPECLRLKTELDPAAADCRAVPLLILNFAENTVKYEAGMGHITEVHVTVRREGDFVHIEFWDTGRGFTPEILANLQDLSKFIQDSKGRHIGISNVVQRAQLILGDACTFRFSNRADAGAQVDIRIPYVPFPGEKELP